MGINKRYIEKYEKAYAGLKATITPIEFLPGSLWYHKEEWREVSPRFIPGVRPNTYWVSNHGRVYSNLKSTAHPNGGIKAHSINGRGYHQVDLLNVDGSRSCVKISRLVMLHFKFVPNCHLLEVDHIDGNKDNNCLWNFEWVSPSVNTHRAIKNGLRPISCNSEYYVEGETTLLSDEEARELYRAYHKGISIYELSDQYKVTYDYIEGLCRGSIRPYIHQEHLSRYANKIRSNKNK